MIPFWVDTTRQVQIRAKSGHLVWVHAIHGFPKTIVRHAFSPCFYERYWQEGDTPHDDKTVEWRRFNDIWSLHRGLELARIRAIRQRIPLLQELHDRCSKSTAQLLGPDHRKPETLAEVTAFATRFLEAIRIPQTHALRAARAQVVQAADPKDSQGRHNPRARAARLLQVSERHLPKRMSDIIGWLGHYAHWADDVSRLQQLAGGFLGAFHQQTSLWLATGIHGGWTPRTLPGIRQIEGSLTKLAAFGGWTAWARHGLRDVRELTQVIERGLTGGLNICRRLQQAIALKQIQAEISRLLIDVEVERLCGTLKVANFRHRLIALQAKVAGADDNLLQERVQGLLLVQLKAATDTLTSKDVEGTRIRHARNHVRLMCQIL